MKKLHVVIPSRTQPAQGVFLDRAIASVRAQVVVSELSIDVVVGLDPGTTEPPLAGAAGVRFVEAAKCSQAAALNAAMACVDGDYVAVLEDDDHWHPHRVQHALAALAHADFVSSTQLEVDLRGDVIRINDFATPSGWFMPLATWHLVGAFDDTYRWHLDNDWLGRLAERGVRRIHQVESTAPLVAEVAAPIRPWLANVLAFGGGHITLQRHPLPTPLIVRLAHAGSGMALIRTAPEAAAASTLELRRLVQRFGHAPW